MAVSALRERSFRITKQIDFCYGHRLLDYVGKCANLHGHNGRAEIEIASLTLDSRGMVVDFGLVKDAMKSWVDEHLDHRMLLRQDDPLIAILERMGEAAFTMAANPTAENIARVIYDAGRDAGLAVSLVRLWETPDSWACYGDC